MIPVGLGTGDVARAITWHSLAHEHGVVTSIDRPDRVSWSCGRCEWTGLGLSSVTAAFQEHAGIAVDIDAGRLTPSGGEWARPE